MFELVKSGGWLMLPIILASVVMLGIVLERLWTLRPSRIAPQETLPKVWQWMKAHKLNDSVVAQLRSESPLGEILAVGIANASQGREIMKERIEAQATQVVHRLERYLSMLGTIAAVTPLLGLLGTVIGMIDVFTVIMTEGTGNPAVLAGGISKALITTAAGLTVAIPALIFHRFFVRRIDALVVTMEQDATKLVEALQYQQQSEAGHP